MGQSLVLYAKPFRVSGRLLPDLFALNIIGDCLTCDNLCNMPAWTNSAAFMLNGYFLSRIVNITLTIVFSRQD